MPWFLPLIDAGLRGMAMALLLLMAGLLLRDRPRLPAAQAGTLLAVGLVLQLFSAAPAFERSASCALQAPLVGVSVANAVAFWLFVRTLFDDDFRWRAWHAATWAFAFAVGSLHCGLVLDVGGPVAWTLRVLLRTVPLAGAVLALHAAVRHWRADLVEARRRLRVFVLVTGVVYTVAQLSARLASPRGLLDANAALLDVLGLLFIAAGVVWRLVRWTGAGMLPLPRESADSIASASPPPAPSLPAADAVDAVDPADARLAATLTQLMAQGHAYREENLTVAGLASRLQVPEYRLRRHINQRLGHRNFNAYINGLRLAQAQAALADPARRDLPVLTLALDAGFQSIGPFNRAFKAATGLTPTEFRRQRLADS